MSKFPQVLHIDTGGRRKRKRKRKRKKSHPEQDFQAQLVNALRRVLPKDVAVFAVPNGGYRTAAEAAILIGQGVMPGFPDLAFVHNGRIVGIELKSKNGVLSDNQRRAHIALLAAGMRTEVARSISEAFERLRELGIPLRIKDWD